MNFFNLHTHSFTENSSVLEVVNQYPWDFDATVPLYSIGIHPWYIKEERLQSDLEILESKLKEDNCLAIGECGLDKRTDVPMELQQDVFEKQLLLAQQNSKPIIIHCVAAFQELIDSVKRCKITVPVIIHGFSKSEQLAQQLVEQGFYLSFGKYLLQNPQLESVFIHTPNDRFFLETDTIATSIDAVYSLAALYKNCSVEKVQDMVKRNVMEVFKIKI